MNTTSRNLMISAYNRYLNHSEKKVLSKHCAHLEYKLDVLKTAKDLAIRLYATKNEILIRHLIRGHATLLKHLNNGSYYFELMRIVNTNSKLKQHESIF